MESHAVLVVDRDGVIQHWSAGAEALLGHSAADCLGNTLDVIIPEEYRPRHWPAFRAAIERGALKFDPAAANIPIFCGDGTVRRFPGRLMVLQDAHRRVIGAIGIFAAPDEEGPPLPDLV